MAAPKQSQRIKNSKAFAAESPTKKKSTNYKNNVQIGKYEEYRVDKVDGLGLGVEELRAAGIGKELGNPLISGKAFLNDELSHFVVWTWIQKVVKKQNGAYPEIRALMFWLTNCVAADGISASIMTIGLLYLNLACIFCMIRARIALSVSIKF